MKLRTKFALILLVVSLVLSGVVLGSAEWFERRTLAAEQEDLNQTAEVAAEQINQRLGSNLDTLQTYAFRADPADIENPQPFIEQFINSTGFFRAQIISSNGTVVGYGGEGVTPSVRRKGIGKNVSDVSYVEKAFKGRRVVSQPERNTPTSFALIFSAPIKELEKNTSVDGVLLAATIFRSEPKGVRYDARQTNPFSPTATVRRPNQTVRIRGDTRNQTNVTLLQPHRQYDKQITGSHKVGAQTGWKLTVIRNKSPLAKRLQALQLIQGVGLLLVLGSIVGLGYWEYTTNLTQTERLLEGFDELGEGRFDYTMSLAGAEEWERISDGFNDMTEGLRQREQAIREREQRLGVLNRVLRHNLQNDMSVILTYAEMLPQMSGDEQDEAVDTIVSKGRGLVSHGKKARQIEKAMESAEEGLVEQNLADIVTETLDDLESDHPEVTVETDLPESVPVAGITSLRDAIESIAENAVEHNDSDDPHVSATVEFPGDDTGMAEPAGATEVDAIQDGGSVDAIQDGGSVDADVGDAGADHGEVVLRISDNGPGIPEYEQEVVSSAEETDLEHGSGLGLFLATWIIEKSGGEIEFEINETGGTDVVVTLPSREAAGDSAKPTVAV